MRRIHVVGVSPRTGTTLIAECMTACFAIDAFEDHEAPLMKHRSRANIYLTKNPGDIWIVRPRLLVDPRFHVIAMLRDPRDVIVSRHMLDPNRYWAPLWFWKGRASLLKRLQQQKRCVLVRYEDLVRDPDALQSMLQRKMPFLKVTGRFSDFASRASPSENARKALGGLRPISTDRIGVWRDNLARVAGQLARHGNITQELIDFGYEADDSWMRCLDGIEPDDSPSHWPETENAARGSRVRRVMMAYSEALKVSAARLLGIPIV